MYIFFVSLFYHRVLLSVQLAQTLLSHGCAGGGGRVVAGYNCAAQCARAAVRAAALSAVLAATGVPGMYAYRAGRDLRPDCKPHE